jgi:ketosteroid isomerase-like protein
MSQENVKVVREAIEAWNAGDMDRLTGLYDPDAIVRAPAFWPEPGAVVGRDAIIRVWSEMRDIWDIDSMGLVSDFLTAGDRVIVRVDWRGAGRGLETNMELTLVYTLRRGLVFGLEFFRDHADALEAAGLSE